jgi:hypothetical protein
MQGTKKHRILGKSLIVIFLLVSSAFLISAPQFVKASPTKTVLFSDDFESGSIDPAKWASNTGAVVQSDIVKDGSYALNITGIPGSGYLKSVSTLDLTDCYISFWWLVNDSLTVNDPDIYGILGVANSGDGGQFVLNVNSSKGDIITNDGDHYFSLSLTADTWYNFTIYISKDVLSGSTNSTVWVDSVQKENLVGTDTYAEANNQLQLYGRENLDTVYDDVEVYTLTTPTPSPSPSASPTPTPTATPTPNSYSTTYTDFTIGNLYTVSQSLTTPLDTRNPFTINIHYTGMPDSALVTNGWVQKYDVGLLGAVGVNSFSFSFSVMNAHTSDLGTHTGNLSYVRDNGGIIEVWDCPLSATVWTTKNDSLTITGDGTSLHVYFGNTLVGTEALPVSSGILTTINSQCVQIGGGSSDDPVGGSATVKLYDSVVFPPSTGGGGGGGGNKPTPTSSGLGGGTSGKNPLQGLLDLLSKIPPWAIWVLIAILIIAGLAGIAKGDKKRSGTPSRSFTNGGM